MIIFMNLSLLILFIIKSYIQNNEFSLIKTALRRFTKVSVVYLNFLKDNNILSFKKFIKLYFFFKKNLKKNFKEYSYIFFFINVLRNKLSLLYLLSNNSVDSKKARFFFKNSKLNIFLQKNKSFFKSTQSFNKNFNSNYLISHRPSSFVKFVSGNYINMLFLRKNKIFNKGRYSRNRQLYRTGVYWCIWLSVFLGYCLYFNFYRFTFNFGYQWWLIFSFLFLFINQKMFKYNFYNFRVLYREIKNNYNWLSMILNKAYSYLVVLFRR